MSYSKTKAEFNSVRLVSMHFSSGGVCVSWFQFYYLTIYCHHTHNHGSVPWIIIVYSQGTRDDDKHNHLL